MTGPPLKSNGKRVLNVIWASITGELAGSNPTALALARVIQVVVLLASPLLSRYWTALPAPNGSFEVRLINIWNAGAGCKFATAIASLTDVASATRAALKAV